MHNSVPNERIIFMKILKKFESIPSIETLIYLSPGVKAFIFDMDGTIFNSEPIHELAMQNLAKKYSITSPMTPEEIHKLLVGKADHLVYDIIKHWPGFPEELTVERFTSEKNDLLVELIPSHKEVMLHPSIHLILTEAKKKNIPFALVTSSEKRVTYRMLEELQIKDYFEFILTRDDCPLHKPHPWPYLKAIEKLNCKSHEVMVFEDSNVGMEAALAALCPTIQAAWY